MPRPKKNSPIISQLTPSPTALTPTYRKVEKYNHLLASGYTPERAKQLAGVVTVNGEETQIEKLGYDEQSAKSVVQEIAHDKSIRPEVRLKASEIMLETLGVKKKVGDGSQVAQTLADILKDIYQSSSTQPRVITVKQVKNIE